MAKRRRRTRRQVVSMPTVSAVRLRRLYRLLQAIAVRQLTRQALLRLLRVDQRTFYRDLEILRLYGIELEQDERGYRLRTPLARVFSILPIPDPRLTLAEAQILSRGQTAAHRKLARIVQSILRT